MIPLALLLVSSLAGPPADTVDLRLRSAILAAEDRRPVDSAGVAPILAGLVSSDTVGRRLAARALGRLERPEALRHLAPLLDDPVASVRAEAANAVGQSALHRGAELALDLLAARLAADADPVVRGVLFRTLGRLPVAHPDRQDLVERLLLQGSHAPGGDADPAVLEGVTHGLASFYRRTGARRPATAAAIERLVDLLGPGHPAPVRRQAIAALVATGHADSGALLDALRDPDWQVRRLALLPARTQDNLLGRARIIDRGWNDPEPAVRYEAVRAWAAHRLALTDCVPAVRALEDPDPRMRLLLLDVLAGCGPAAAPVLQRRAGRNFGPDDWHEPARALVALARIAPAAADSLLPRFAASGIWWARLYAARAAAASNQVAALERMALDDHPNVREAALEGLRARRGHAARPFYLQALTSADYQLVITAARALDSTPEPGSAIPALARALERITRERRETSRDARLAILTTLDHIGGPDQATLLRRYLADFDPVVAARAAGILSRWTGAEARPAPRPLDARPAPEWRELERLAVLRPVIVMRGGGRVVLRLYPFDAPTNAARFVRLARSGWFDGLTFHRVVPGFVIQGGSPGANEYAGDGPFTRDELGLRSNRRGTVGLSTRGRDTGDGQIFINLTDNIRLDHDYTIFAEVIEGMEVLDQVLEGAVIERIEIGPPR